MKSNEKGSNGVVQSYNVNRHEDYDGFVLEREGKLVHVKFPPHTARFVRDVAREGESVELVVRERGQLVSIRNEKKDKQVNIDSIKPPHPAEVGSSVEFTIAQPAFTRDKHDEITGVLYENNFIHLHPDEWEITEKALEAAKTITVKAKKRVDTGGFVNAQGHTVYHGLSVKLNKKEKL